MAPRIDFVLRSNAGFAWPVQFTDAVEKPYDWSGSTFVLQAATAPGQALVVDLESGDGIMHDDLPTAALTIELPSGLTPGNYVYDMLRLVAGEEPETAMWGTIQVEAGVSAP